MKTVHERIPLAGLSKLPSVPQIAKVKAGTKRRWLPLLGRILGGAGLSWVGSAFGKEEPLSSWTLDCMHGVGELLVDTPKSLPQNPCSISSLLLRLLREQAALTPGSYPKFTASSGDQRNGETGLGIESRVGLQRRMEGRGQLGAFTAEDGWG